MTARLRVTVLGAGIIGATTAYELAKAGARVRVFDTQTEPGRGVSGASFGWINASTVDPAAEPEAFALRFDAFRRFTELNASLRNRLFPRPAGALVWQPDDEATAAHVDRHRQAGNPITVVHRSRFAQLEPQFRGAPGLAAWCPQEFAIDVTRATHVLLRAAKDAGAELVFGETVEDVVSISGRIKSVTTASRQYGADAVVYAGGSAETELSRRLNVHRHLTPSPAALLRFPASDRVLRRIICGPAIEARQDRNLVIHVPEYLTGNFDADELDNVCATTRATLVELFGDVLIGPGTALAADRPMPIDKMWVGPSESTANLFMAIAHPGVILAPHIAETIRLSLSL